MQQVRQPKSHELRLHSRIKPRIDPRRTVAMRPVPCVDLPQFGDELFRRRGLLQGRIAFAITEDQQAGRVGPCSEIGRILRRIDLRLALLVAAEPEIIDVAIAGAEFAGDLHAALPLFIVPFVVRSCGGAGDAGMVVMLAAVDGLGGCAAHVAALARPLITRCP